MSLIRPALNLWLRKIEKPIMARERDPKALRRRFELNARLFFHAPWGTERRKLTLAGRPSLKISHRAPSDLCVLYLHGGAFIFGSPACYAAMLARLCKETGAWAILPDYRKAPEHPFPAATQDVRACYEALLDQGQDPSRIAIGGDSAGGNLALGLLAELLREGAALPAGVFAFSPVTDLNYEAPSITENAERDAVLPTAQIPLMQDMYLAGHDPSDPRASPLFADFQGAPPVWLGVSRQEILLDDGLRMMDHLKAQGVSVTSEITDDLPHVWPLFHNVLPEGRATLRQLGVWIRQLPDARGDS